MSIEIGNETDVPVEEHTLVHLARFVLGRLRVHPLAELSIQLVDAAAIEQLHLRYLDEPGPTDVLSFPMDELRPGGGEEDPEPGLLGDVVICPQVAAEQARRAGHSTAEEIHLLTTHGILHLLGYDHADPAAEQEMFGLQQRLLADWRDSLDVPETSGESAGPGETR